MLLRGDRRQRNYFILFTTTRLQTASQHLNQICTDTRRTFHSTRGHKKIRHFTVHSGIGLGATPVPLSSLHGNSHVKYSRSNEQSTQTAEIRATALAASPHIPWAPQPSKSHRHNIIWVFLRLLIPFPRGGGARVANLAPVGQRLSTLFECNAF